MKKLKIVFIALFLFSLSNNTLWAEPFFLDFKYILNQSDAGKKAQASLKNELEKGFKNLNDREKKLQEEEKKNYTTKKIYL